MVLKPCVWGGGKAIPSYGKTCNNEPQGIKPDNVKAKIESTSGEEERNIYGIDPNAL